MAEKPTPGLVAALSSAPIATLLPDFRIDVLVLQKRGLLFHHGQKRVWRQLVIQGQQLTVQDVVTSKTQLVAHTTHVSLQPQPGHQYLLQVHGKTVLTLFCPSGTLFCKLQTILCLSCSTPHWIRPPQTVLQALVDVGATIVETDRATTATRPPSNVTPTHVATYLRHVKPVYDHVLTLANETDLLDYLARLEVKYVTFRIRNNFAHTVHQHNASDYARAQSDPHWRPARDDYATCALCGVPLAADAAFAVRVAGVVLPCPACGCRLSQETFRLAALYRDHATIRRGNTCVELPRVPHGATYASYLKLVAVRLEQLPSIERQVVADMVVTYLQRLDLVAAMARHVHFLSFICSQYRYWSHSTVLEASVIRYHQFLTLGKPVLMPTFDIALVRYVHQTVATSPLGFFSLPSSSEAADFAYAETFLLWAETFQCPYSSFAPSYDAFVKAKDNPMKQLFRQKQWETFHAVPSRDCRFVGVDESSQAVVATAVAVHHKDKGTVPPTAANYVAVIGTPLLDSRVQPEAAALQILGGERSLDSLKMYFTMEAALEGLLLVATALLAAIIPS
ncbi:Aste57867_9496 [Aphanomyces stellatus]|uniref:Aste57867_9496 protein n=1 Tax=Aphanomyces stellatus TaxID=120398 RepID=A0A485KNE0_9STRA|nr:hypothetical protein As57867_009459 [Aphanomyces stellatus]VFT86375.1 Aste57867_9496 [Aphanomyces stellatus]